MASAVSLDRVLEYNGHTAHQARLAIALGEMTDTYLARRFFGGNTQYLKRFIEQNADEIAAIATKLQENNPPGLAGLWIGQKNLRVAEMQHDVDDINSVLDFYRDQDGFLEPRFAVGKEYANLIRVKTGLIRSVADEIDGTRRATVLPDDERQVVRFVIGGDDDIAEGLT